MSIFSPEYTNPHSKCKGYRYWTPDGYEYNCEYESLLSCEECKYCGGLKDPNAKCNKPRE
jgi:hypothetical protein